MEDNFKHPDFEEFLQDEVRNHRMYPSDAVWRDINKKLHGEKKWPALTIAALALFSATVLTCVYFTPKPNIFSLKPVTQQANSNPLSKSNVLNNLTSSAPFAMEKGNSTVIPGKTQPSAAVASLDIASSVDKIRLSNKPKELINTKVVENGQRSRIIVNQPERAIVKTQPRETTVGLISELNSNEFESNTSISNPLVINSDSKIISKKSVVIAEGSQAAKEYSDKNMVDDFLADHKDDVPLYTASKKRTVKNKFGYQVYIAPSVSYRKLVEDRSILEDNAAGPVGLNYVADVNKVVRHKPGTGLEAGVSFLYNMTEKFRVKTGLQFNVRQYSIEAYRSGSELASITLVGDNRIDTVNTMAIYRTSNGYYAHELVNRYYQLAVPLGIEWEVIGTQRIQLNVAASIQPTYLLNHNAYLLSSNFKNYTENPDMVRTWNINSNIEAFLSFVVGDFKWQLGPQLRYQPYSTFIKEYPIKEHLMDYGIKVGVSKTF